MRSIAQRLFGLVRGRGTSLLVLVSATWVIVALVVASTHGAQRRRTFNAAEGKAWKVHAPAQAQR